MCFFVRLEQAVSNFKGCKTYFETAAANARFHCDGELKSSERQHPDWCLQASVVMSCFPWLPGFANNIRAKARPLLWGIHALAANAKARRRPAVRLQGSCPLDRAQQGPIVGCGPA